MKALDNSYCEPTSAGMFVAADSAHRRKDHGRRGPYYGWLSATAAGGRDKRWRALSNLLLTILLCDVRNTCQVSFPILPQFVLRETHRAAHGLECSVPAYWSDYEKGERLKNVVRYHTLLSKPSPHHTVEVFHSICLFNNGNISFPSW
jgi:hypothetical protein